MNETLRVDEAEGGGAPLCTQLYNDLRQCIENGQWKLGDRIPKIDVLIETYGVSRITVRGAIERLERDRRVRRAQGKGTYVIKDIGKNRELLMPTTWGNSSTISKNSTPR